jgi:dienelactone hydrolase
MSRIMGRTSVSFKAKKILVSSVFLALLLNPCTGWAATTPMDAPLKEDGTTLIECDVRDAKENMTVYATLNGGSENPSKSTKTEGYHYQLYIPKGYHENKDYRYPCLFISSPGGKANMGAMAERLKQDQWIVVMLQESKNGSTDWLRNFLAAHDDVVDRVRVAKGAKFSTGLSGGARASSVYALMRPGMAGIICQAAGFAYGFEPDYSLYQAYPTEILVAGSFGDKDFNLFESMTIVRTMKKSKTQVRYFTGGHAWCPATTFNSLMDWTEESLFLTSTKPGSSMGPRPVLTTPKGTSAKTVKKPEPLSAEAFLWYLRKCKRQLDQAEAKEIRYLHLERLLNVVTNGKLEQSAAVAAEVKKWKTELATLKQAKEVVDFNKTARAAYTDAQNAEVACLTLLRRGASEYGKLKFSSSEIQALKKMIAAYRTVEEKHPNSPFVTSAKDAADSWTVALSKGQ